MIISKVMQLLLSLQLLEPSIALLVSEVIEASLTLLPTFSLCAQLLPFLAFALHLLFWTALVLFIVQS